MKQLSAEQFRAYQQELIQAAISILEEKAVNPEQTDVVNQFLAELMESGCTPEEYRAIFKAELGNWVEDVCATLTQVGFTLRSLVDQKDI